MNTTSTSTESPRSGWAVWGLWLPGLLVALGAGVATAHGLYEVAAAAAVPTVIAWLYPLITDGLALVAYVATARLTGSARRYAWAVVVLAAGLSGLAQASYLAGGVGDASPLLRFGVGAWPAVAAAIVAHLLFLIAADRPTVNNSTAENSGERPVAPAAESAPASNTAVLSTSDDRPTVQLPAVEPERVQTSAVQPGVHRERVQPVQPSRPVEAPSASSPGVQSRPSGAARRVEAKRAQAPARERADEAAQRYTIEHNGLPTVTQLMELAEVSRGTAGEALKALRDKPAPLHLVHEHDQQKATS
ncbi:hypothetical protein BAY61_01340 [Prauserella marina]|uniref:Uncharacterized protein n=1 Tax=Prauserella marina TaxID=530584 RepID=A0A222VJA4_9PSEU|nr:hypothetical protein [Prauserella marina]ASR33853.1 hypothetical protein BAY61_01340 [Prauserella marina]PWV82441.1 hypothetical protein DES30_102684 [Prauserella marina]SDC69305.1 hypothetical protein SAMN05421630_103220 [Prauserella marina]